MRCVLAGHCQAGRRNRRASTPNAAGALPKSQVVWSRHNGVNNPDRVPMVVGLLRLAILPASNPDPLTACRIQPFTMSTADQPLPNPRGEHEMPADVGYGRWRGIPDETLHVRPDCTRSLPRRERIAYAEAALHPKVTQQRALVEAFFDTWRCRDIHYSRVSSPISCQHSEVVGPQAIHEVWSVRRNQHLSTLAGLPAVLSQFSQYPRMNKSLRRLDANEWRR